MNKNVCAPGFECGSERKVVTTWPGCRPLRHPGLLISSQSWVMFSSLGCRTLTGPATVRNDIMICEGWR